MQQLPPGSAPPSLILPSSSLPTPSMQSQIHELAKTLPPPRKQNTACDACRSRKVKCHRIPGQDKCAHCQAKNYPCTHFVMQATSEKRRNKDREREKEGGRKVRTSNSGGGSGPDPSNPYALYNSPSQSAFPPSIGYPGLSNAAYGSYGGGRTYPSQPGSPQNPFAPLASSQNPHNPHGGYGAFRQHGFYPPITVDTPTRDVLNYLFAPPSLEELGNYANDYLNVSASSSGSSSSSSALSSPTTPTSPLSPMTPSATSATNANGKSLSLYAPWGEHAHKLEDEVFRTELTFDLMEIYFQIVHSRLPLLNPTTFRARLRASLSPPPSSSTGTTASNSDSTSTSGNGGENGANSPGSDKTLHPALVLTVLSFGSKFSEHPLFLADRALHRPSLSSSQSPQPSASHGISLISKTFINRTRELAEQLKVHRIPSPDHVVTGLLLETLQSQTPDDPNAFHRFWLGSATRHLLELQINHKSVAAQIPDPESRGTLIFAWWMTCICDAYSSLYYRHKPVLDDDDYDIDFYTADPITPSTTNATTTNAGDTTGSGNGPSPREQLEFLGYYRAAHSLARTARQMSRQLWRPITDSDGIPFAHLRDFAGQLRVWREKYLAKVGVPKTYDGWDFVTTVSCFASDAQYHVMWIVLFNALDDYGVKEINEIDRMFDRGSTPPQGPSGAGMSTAPPHNGGNQGSSRAYIEDAMRRVGEEALNGALRIAALTSVLTTNEYLKLDPAVVEFHIIVAGHLLARLGRHECMTCILGLEQYSHSYEEAGEHANEIRKIYEWKLQGQGGASVSPISGNTSTYELNHMAGIIKQVAMFPSTTSEPDAPPHTPRNSHSPRAMGTPEAVPMSPSSSSGSGSGYQQYQQPQQMEQMSYSGPMQGMSPQLGPTQIQAIGYGINTMTNVNMMDVDSVDGVQTQFAHTEPSASVPPSSNFM